MPIIGLILGIFIFVVVWWARLKMLGEVAEKAADVVDTIIKAPRRWVFRRQTNGDPIDHLDDPRIGAILFMFILASSDGVLDVKELEIIEGQAREKFNCSDKEWQDLSVHGRWAAGRVQGNLSNVKKLSRKIFALAPAAGESLFEMMSTLEDNMCAPEFLDDSLRVIEQVFAFKKPRNKE